jgi:flagellar biosynthesis anti-sigma factor FlgM
MEISSQPPALQPLDSAGAVKSTSEPGGAAASRVPGQHVQQDVTSLALGSALSGDDTRVSRVQMLQGQIAGGTYQVAAQAVAAKLLDNMAEGA